MSSIKFVLMARGIIAKILNFRERAHLAARDCTLCGAQ